MVLSVQDPKYNVYRLTEDIEYEDGTIIKEGTKVLSLVNDPPNEDGDIWID